MCDNKGPSITVVKNNNGKIAGGYTSQSWTTANAYKTDYDSYLFSVDNKKVYPVKANFGNAIYDHTSYGPTFGGGHDLYIASSAASSTSSYSNLGHTYHTPVGVAYSSNEAKNALFGVYNFQPTQVEVFVLSNF